MPPTVMIQRPPITSRLLPKTRLFEHCSAGICGEKCRIRHADMSWKVRGEPERKTAEDPDFRFGPPGRRHDAHSAIGPRSPDGYRPRAPPILQLVDLRQSASSPRSGEEERKNGGRLLCRRHIDRPRGFRSPPGAMGIARWALPFLRLSGSRMGGAQRYPSNRLRIPEESEASGAAARRRPRGADRPR